jgi:hypothetical protein
LTLEENFKNDKAVIAKQIQSFFKKENEDVSEISQQLLTLLKNKKVTQTFDEWKRKKLPKETFVITQVNADLLQTVGLTIKKKNKLKRVDGKYVYEKQVCNIQESTFIEKYKQRVTEKKKIRDLAQQEFKQKCCFIE